SRKILVPALIDAVKIPLEFRRVQAADLTQWDGSSESLEFKQFLRAVDLELQENLQPGSSEAAGVAILPAPPGSVPAGQHAESVRLQSESFVGSATRAGRWRAASWTLAALSVVVVIAGLTFWFGRDARATPPPPGQPLSKARLSTEERQTILEAA